MLLFYPLIINAQIVFDFNTAFKFLKGKDAASLTATWISPGYNDSAWPSGIAPFRYGDGTTGTVLDDMINVYSTVCLRGTFTALNAAYIKQISLKCDFDDGFIIWLNGNILQSENAPDPPLYNSFSTALRESGTITNYIVDAAALNLKEGINTIAVQVFNTSLESSDFYFDMSMTAEAVVPVPDGPRISQKPVFSHKAGFYSNPFLLTIISPSTDYTISYTLDGSNPENSPTRVNAGNIANVSIDPLSTNGRPLTPAVIVRASLFGAGIRPSFTEGRTYIFTSEVSVQDNPGGDWPTTDVNGQIIDLPMDSKVVDDFRYSNKMDFSLKAIPSISIMTNIKYLFDSDSGLYVNAIGHGEEWERECSAELINPDGSPGFDVNAGLRMRGGWSRHNNYPKHAFRLFFTADYGMPKLNFPLFGDEGASKFDKIDLRCEQNYSWANSGWESAHNTGIREVFSRDTQRDMGQPYTRSHYYHLYLNGMYWGLYQTQERAEANYAATYLGGLDTDYDVVKVNTENFSYVVEATDGDLTVWQEIWDLCSPGFADNSNYFKLEGKDFNGNRTEGSPVLIDIDNLIDYMLVIFYTGNFDSPTSSFGSNKGCNNFFGIYNKTLKNRGFTFFAHDSEHSLMSDVCPPGTGLYEDRVNLASRAGSNMEVFEFNRFHPQWLHEKMTQNAEYRLRFADRAYNYFKAGNVLSEEACLKRFNDRAIQLDNAIIAESARWGDSKEQFPVKTRDDNWIPELNNARSDFFPYRTDILKDQLATANLYPSVMPSDFKVNGSVIQSESYNIQNSATLSFQNPNSSGEVFYTIDGSDPRLMGGAVNAKAIRWLPGSDISINNSVTVKTRALQGGVWSALNFINLLNSNEDYSKLKVTEVMYHPTDAINGTDTISGSSLEFIEFKNTGSTSINLSGMVLDSAVHCVIPPNSLLGPQQFYLIASKPSAFTEFYGIPPSDNFSGNLSNGGEYVLLTDPLGNPVISFTYNDINPWPVEADGLGFSLNSTVNDPTGDPNSYLYWKSSNFYNGTPFRDDYGVDVKYQDSEELAVNIYPNPASEMLNVEVKSEKSIENLRLQIFNMKGVLMYNDDIDRHKIIDLKEYGIGPGVYLVKLEGQKILQTRRLIVSW
jgi:hypothetical protein